MRQFLHLLRENKEIVDVNHPVDPYLEIAEIHRRVVEEGGPALFFHNVKNSKFPVVTNLFGTRKRVDLAFQNRPDQLIKSLVELITSDFPPKLSTLWKKRKALKSFLHIGTKQVKKAPIKESRIDDLEQIPLLTCWPKDGGPFITLPLVYTEPPKGGPSNLGMYRIQRYNKKETGLHFQIQKGGGFHYAQAEARNEEFPVHIFIGGPPALMLSAIAPLPENMSEILLAGLLQGKKLSTTRTSHSRYPLISECEFALVGKAAPKIRRPEGPFGDHYGYYSLTHDFPLFECQTIYHRKNAIYPATVVGKPKQEDFYIGEYLQELLSPLFPIAMPGVKDLWSYGETGFHSLAAAIVDERYHRECMKTAFRILGEGQLALTKFLLLTDRPVQLRNFKTVLTTILERIRPETDLFIFSNLSLDTLDYTGPKLNEGSRAVILGIGEKVRELPTQFVEKVPNGVKKIGVYSPGCLVIEANTEIVHLLQETCFAEWPLLILVDDVDAALKNDTTFLWTVFTRCEPAADIYAGYSKVQRHHICYSFPLLIDARMKPSYPPVLEPDENTIKLVDQNWKNYFPS